MIPVVNLDNQNFEEIFENARKKIPKIYPEWTDYNEHDPGITFLQLFSWFKEMQQYHLNQIGREQLEMYLKLLNMKQKRKQPAQALVSLRRIDKDISLPVGSRMWAGEIPFETVYSENLEEIHLVECICQSENQEVKIGKEILQSGSKMRCFPFGKEPEAGNSFVIKLDHNYTPGKSYSLYFNIFDEYEIPRNPEAEGFYPLAKVTVEYYGKDGYKECEQIEDHTGQLLHSGIIRFVIPDEMQMLEDETYSIRLRLIQCEYDLAPVIQSIFTNVVPVQQKETIIHYEDVSTNVEHGEISIVLNSRIAIEGKLDVYLKKNEGYFQIKEDNLVIQKEKGSVKILVTGLEDTNEESVMLRAVACNKDYQNVRSFGMTGFPYQTISLNDKELLYDDFKIMVEDIEHPGMFYDWEKVEQFHCSGPEDRHYRFDEETGNIIFGDCEQGMAPEGELRILQYVRSLGNRGNVKKEQINSLEYEESKIKVSNYEDVSGGENKEDIDSCFLRFKREFHEINRAVTTDDFEYLVKHTPGLRIQKVKAVPTKMFQNQSEIQDENSISVVVQPYGMKVKNKLSRAYEMNIKKMLDECRLIGTKVHILSPYYIGINVFAELVVYPHYLNARKEIEDVVEKYISDNVANFGSVVAESDLYGFLDTLDCVKSVKNISIQAQGRGIQRTINGDLQMPMNGLVYLKQADYIITIGQA